MRAFYNKPHRRVRSQDGKIMNTRTKEHKRKMEVDIPNIVLSDNEKDRNVISFGNEEKSPIDGVEVIRSNEKSIEKVPEPQTSFEDFLLSSPKSQSSGVIKLEEKKPLSPPPSPPKSKKEEYNFDDITSFINPIKKKHDIEPTPQEESYKSDNESYNESYKYVDSPKSQKSYQSSWGGNDNEQSSTQFRHQDEEKQSLLIELQRLEHKGVRLTRTFSMKNSLEDIRFEVEKQKDLIMREESVKWMQNALITFVHGVEIMNNKFDPIGAKLNGWSNSVMEDISSYESIFERLHEKYKGSVEMAPELELLLTLAQSAFMFHLMETIFKSASPFLGQAIRSDPNLMNGLMGATARAADQSRKQVPQPPPQASNTPMTGPSFNIGDILGPIMGMAGGMGGMPGMPGSMPAPNRSGPMPHPGPQVIPPGNNAFREAMDRPPPPPMSTREPPRRSAFQDDSDRFSIASSKSDGSEIRAPTIEEKSNKKTIYM